MSNAYGAGAPGAAPDPNMLQRLWNYLNPVSSAQAADSVQAKNPLNSPTPVPAALQGGGPPVPPIPPITTPSNASPSLQQPYGPQLPPPTNAPMSYGPQQSPTPWFTSSNTPYAPNPAVGAPLPPVRPTNPAVARGSNRPAVKIPASATASVPAGGSPFTMVSAPNANPGTGGGMLGGGGALARGGSRPMISAIDLSSLFGRR